MTDAERKAAPLEDWRSLELARGDPISINEAMLASIAISLKRIADALDEKNVGKWDSDGGTIGTIGIWKNSK